MQSLPEFMLRVASDCKRLAYKCFDLGAARELNRVADELKEKAGELDGKQPAPPRG
jgi:hypothetical protein